MCLVICRIRNYLYVQRHMGAARAADHIPEFAKRVVAAYDADGSLSKRWDAFHNIGSGPCQSSCARQVQCQTHDLHVLCRLAMAPGPTSQHQAAPAAVPWAALVAAAGLAAVLSWVLLSK